MTVLLEVDLGRVFLQPLVLLHHQDGEGHRHHDHPLVADHHSRQGHRHHHHWGEGHRHHDHPLVVDHHSRQGHRHHHPMVLLVLQLMDLKQAPETEVVWLRVLGWQTKKSFHHCREDHQAQILLVVYHQCHHNPLVVHHQCRERQRREGHLHHHLLEDQEVTGLIFLRQSEIAEIRVART
jgi:hypothetical protein